MDPIANQGFSIDSQKFIYQPDPGAVPINPHAAPPKLFRLDPAEKSGKAKKDLEKKKKQKGDQKDLPRPPCY